MSISSILLCMLLLNSEVLTGVDFKCILPYDCELSSSAILTNIDRNEIKLDNEEGYIIGCNTWQDYRFKFDDTWFMNNNKSICTINKNYLFEIIEFDWPTKKAEWAILDKTFNFTNVLNYMNYMKLNFQINFMNLKGIELNIMKDQSNTSIIKTQSIKDVLIINSELSFYIDGKFVNTCEDIIKWNRTIRSVFQIEAKADTRTTHLDNCQFKQKLCPLVFVNAKCWELYVIGLIDTFYKRNILSFWNWTDESLNSNIRRLYLSKVQGVKLDLSLVDPYVFERTELIDVGGYVDSVSGELFDWLIGLRRIKFKSAHFRKLVHKNGIEWIKQINLDINISDFSNNQTVSRKAYHARYILVTCSVNTIEESISSIFPDSDFCLYKDFPFQQFVVIGHFCDKKVIEKSLSYREISCTYLWLTQYYKYFVQDVKRLNFPNIYNNMKALLAIIDKFYKNRNCNFKQKLEYCNKTNYQVKDIWSKSDYFILNKKLQIAIKISTYLISLFGIATNIIVIVVILHKDNNEFFKKIKQYSYLYANSIFAALICLIEILSWMSECFYPFEVFCPEMRKLLSTQYFKILFKECFVTTFRFMCSFCYIAFALNRISLLGKDHGKLVNFFADVKIKYYLIATLLISIGLSVIKFFKYSINHGLENLNFPISNEMDIFSISDKKSTVFEDAYIITNSISDILNYVVFVLVCFVIDLCMIVQLRRVIDDKIKKTDSMNNSNNKKKELEDIVNKAVKMVVINTAIGLLFKWPLIFIPLVNVYAEFYFKSVNNRYISPKFAEFYSSLFDSGFYTMFQDLSDLLYTLSITIQIFIYIRFDTKFKAGFDRIILRKKDEKSNKSNNKLSTTNKGKEIKIKIRFI